ncbi:deoxyribose-phosphate aldolase [uncultured Lutibacter sp.]|uniref:deoxyribose-phosphate aldolase n=1 Tax=uncultured Lutibacter sp. TaxID=437739 RepID=UPI00260A5971|nr:deoxyribose-phosphate aldolase [uncultured Lutibacter sp.]
MCEVNVNQFLESTYLKTPIQAGISPEATKKIVEELIHEAVNNKFKLVMIRPDYVSLAKEMIANLDSYTSVGTVIGFHEGTYSTEEKIAEAEKAIADGVDELDFVANYEAFKNGKINLVKSEIFKCTKLVLDNNKVAKWIIEIAALNDEEIIEITQLIRDVVLDNFGEEKALKVFVKSSTGFYKTEGNKPNGATFEGMKLIIENAKPLPTKAAGGVKSFKDALKMIEIGVRRIGTSSALAIADGNIAKEGY